MQPAYGEVGSAAIEVVHVTNSDSRSRPEAVIGCARTQALETKGAIWCWPRSGHVACYLRQRGVQLDVVFRVVGGVHAVRFIRNYVELLFVAFCLLSLRIDDSLSLNCHKHLADHWLQCCNPILVLFGPQHLALVLEGDDLASLRRCPTQRYRFVGHEHLMRRGVFVDGVEQLGSVRIV